MTQKPPPKRKRSPWFAFYPDDYMGGTRMMSLAAKGAFVDLLAWQFAHSSIPADTAKICRIVGATREEWEVIAAEVLEKFERRGDCLVNSRMEKEREERDGIREKRVEAGKKGADNRWDGKPDSKPMANAIANAIDLPCTLPMASTATSSVSLAAPESISAQSPTAPSPHPKPDKPVGASADRFEEFWKAVPVKIGKGAARRAWKNAIKLASPDAIIAGIPKFRKYEAARASQQDYRPLHPATWLNGERWLDEGVSESSNLFAPKPQKPIAPEPPDFREWFAANIMHAERFTPEQISEKWGEKYYRDKYGEGRKIA